jgi:hypothetical protein
MLMKLRCIQHSLDQLYAQAREANGLKADPAAVP